MGKESKQEGERWRPWERSSRFLGPLRPGGASPPQQWPGLEDQTRGTSTKTLAGRSGGLLSSWAPFPASSPPTSQPLSSLTLTPTSGRNSSPTSTLGPGTRSSPGETETTHSFTTHTPTPSQTVTRQKRNTIKNQQILSYFQTKIRNSHLNTLLI